MTDDFMIDVIARALDDECPFDKAAAVLNHQSWLDVVEHLWKDKGLRMQLMEAYKTEIANARAQELLESESDSLPM